MDDVKLDFDIRHNCHEIYDSVYRNNQKSIPVWTSRHDRALVRTYDLIEQYTHEGNIYLRDLHDNDKFMYDTIKQYCTINFLYVQNLLRGNMKGLELVWYEYPLITVIKYALTTKLKDMGYTYLFKQQRKKLYDAFFRGWNFRKSVNANNMNPTVLTDISNLLKRWNDVIYNSPRYKDKVIMFRGFKFDIAKKLKNMKIGERHTEYGFTSLTLNYKIAQQYTIGLGWLGYGYVAGYVAGFEITPHTPLLWIDPMNGWNKWEAILCCGAVFEKIGANSF